jgi:hypothetical protein
MTINIELMKQVEFLSKITVDFHQTIVESISTMHLQIEELNSYINKLIGQIIEEGERNER